MRGLKYNTVAEDREIVVSHPTRVRGLKFVVLGLIHQSHSVAPYTGAWIEIPLFCVNKKAKRVAPYTGAWIEIVRVISV